MQRRVLIRLPEELAGPRVLVRPFRAEDGAALWAGIDESRAHLAPWLPWVRTYESEENAHSFCIHSRAKWLLREDMNLGTFERATGAFLGGCGIHPRDWEVRAFEIGYWIRRSAEGQGYVAEAVQLLARLAFGALHANRVEIRMDPRNQRSRNVAARLGFVLEGTLRNAGPDGEGKPSDRHVYALIPAEFQALPWAAG